MDVDVEQPGDEVLAARVETPTGLAARELTWCDRRNLGAIEDDGHFGLRRAASAFDNRDMVDDQTLSRACEQRREQEDNCDQYRSGCH
jgi:hypothetical protein